MLRSVSILALLAIGSAVSAQGLDALPDRPIKRAEVISVVQRQFAAMDVNHDGVVTQAEFDRYRARQGNAPAKGIEAMSHVGGRWFERADADGDGRVTLMEAQARPLRFFDIADTNRDGVVSLEERRIASVLMSLGGG